MKKSRIFSVGMLKGGSAKRGRVFQHGADVIHFRFKKYSRGKVRGVRYRPKDWL